MNRYLTRKVTVAADVRKTILLAKIRFLGRFYQFRKKLLLDINGVFFELIDLVDAVFEQPGNKSIDHIHSLYFPLQLKMFPKIHFSDLLVSSKFFGGACFLQISFKNDIYTECNRKVLLYVD